MGSSPLARGLRDAPHHHHRRLGIIPARAGFTRRVAFRVCVSWDHPRSRGVYRRRPRRRPRPEGSSPLARGLLRGGGGMGGRRGIIPARAGFTSSAVTMVRRRWDHPRSRGVYDWGAPVSESIRGSSPLARGLRPAQTSSPATVWIIPARAGFTKPLHPTTPHAGDHPRSRGVYPRPRATSRIAFWIIPARAGFTMAGPVLSGPLPGSSPLARGLLPTHPLNPSSGRIIPARAGFTPLRARCSRRKPDHPRSRGVYYLYLSSIYSIFGSSPLARGLRAMERWGGARAWIIPARAGFTKRWCAPIILLPDHPRSRGVYAPGGEGMATHLGSSPLARGLPVLRIRSGVPEGIIPARAGFTGAPDRCGRAGGDHPRSRGVYL